jgi:Sec-independent protein translocase protein TatA
MLIRAKNIPIKVLFVQMLLIVFVLFGDKDLPNMGELLAEK